MSIMATLEAQSAAEAAAAELRQMSRSPNPTYGRDFAIERRVSLHTSSSSFSMLFFAPKPLHRPGACNCVTYDYYVPLS